MFSVNQFILKNQYSSTGFLIDILKAMNNSYYFMLHAKHGDKWVILTIIQILTLKFN